MTTQTDQQYGIEQIKTMAQLDPIIARILARHNEGVLSWEETLVQIIKFQYEKLHTPFVMEPTQLKRLLILMIQDTTNPQALSDICNILIGPCEFSYSDDNNATWAYYITPNDPAILTNSVLHRIKE